MVHAQQMHILADVPNATCDRMKRFKFYRELHGRSRQTVRKKGAGSGRTDIWAFAAAPGAIGQTGVIIPKGVFSE
jgi:hypothetical protein